MHLNLLGGLIVIFLSKVVHAETLKVCYDQWPPMTIFPTSDMPNRGVVIDMLEQIYSDNGYKLVYFEVPLARGLDMVAKGDCDMLPEYLYSKNAEKGFVYAEQPTFSYPSAFVVRAEDTWRYDGIASIKGRRIATGPGWDYSSMSPDYQNYIDDPQNSKWVEVIAGDDDVIDRAFRMIVENRVDAYADNLFVLQNLLKRMGLTHKLKIVGPGLEKKLVEMPIFSLSIPQERRERLMAIWNKGRIALKGSREQAILKKYNVELDSSGL